MPRFFVGRQSEEATARVGPRSIAGPGSGPGEFNFPHNICCDADGWVYVADRENHRIQIFDGDGPAEVAARRCWTSRSGSSPGRRASLGARQKGPLRNGGEELYSPSY